MMLKLALAAALVLGTSAAMAGQGCPRMQQQAAYLALLEETGSADPTAVTEAEPAEAQAGQAAEAEAEDLVN